MSNEVRESLENVLAGAKRSSLQSLLRGTVDRVLEPLYEEWFKLPERTRYICICVVADALLDTIKKDKTAVPRKLIADLFQSEQVLFNSTDAKEWDGSGKLPSEILFTLIPMFATLKLGYINEKKNLDSQ